MKYRVLLFGRKNDVNTENLKNFLKKKFLNVKVLYSENQKKKSFKNQIKNWKGDFIFSFRSKYILKRDLLKKVKYSAINFHPGPPEYRGVGCVNFAVLNETKSYGVTAHLINSKIDAGHILKVKRFRIEKNETLNKILNKTHKELFDISKEIINLCYKKPNIKQYITKIKWSKKIYTKKDLDKLYKIDKKSSYSRIKKIIRATQYKNFKPYIKVKKFKFTLDENR